MKKIPTVFERDAADRSKVTRMLTPECEWVLAGEGVATRKFDGACCMVRDGKLFKRYDAKKGRTPPPHFEPAQEPDAITGHRPGWLPVGDGPDDQYFRQAWEALSLREIEDGTFELVGPRVQGGAERAYPNHILLKHGAHLLRDAPREHDAVRDYLAANPIEGIVWHNPDGRMAKIKRRDFGLVWPISTP